MSRIFLFFQDFYAFLEMLLEIVKSKEKKWYFCDNLGANESFKRWWKIA